MTPERIISELNTNGQSLSKDELRRVLNSLIQANATTLSRVALTRQLGDRRRDLEDECGYPKGPQEAEYYQEIYDKDPVAQRVVQLMPRECFQVQPSVYEDEDADTITEFEEVWDALGQNLDGGYGDYKEEKGSSVTAHLRRLDEQSRIGRYGIAWLGINDGLPLDQPAAGFEEEGSIPVRPPEKGQSLATPFSSFSPYRLSVNAAANRGRKLSFIRVFPETLAQITEWESNPTSPRFGLPVKYLVTFNDPRHSYSGTGLPLASTHVHWSRVVHVADNVEGSNPALGMSSLHAVRYRIHDIMKLYGGSAEMYWLGAFPGLFLSANTPTGEDMDFNPTDAKSMVEYYFNGLQRYMAMKNMTPTMLSPTVVDPTPQIQVHIEAICIRLGVPKRVFMGSERGELASSQDDAAWNDRVKERQNGHVTPCVIVPFVNRLIQMGVLPKPRDGFRVWWPDITSHNETERADLALKKVQAITTFVGGGGEQAMALPDFWTRIMGEDEEEAEAILDNLAEVLEEKAEEEAMLAEDESLQSEIRREEEKDFRQQELDLKAEVLKAKTAPAE